jgi:hypothetical protein
MKTVKALLIVGLFASMSSCYLGYAPLKKQFFRSYVRYYYSADSIKLEKISSRGKRIVAIRPAPVGRTFRPSDIGGYDTKGDSKALYEALCRKHNDVSYNRTVEYHTPDELSGYEYIGTDFVSIHVVSDSDFDAEHPAGADLGDILCYAFYSPKKYIDSGYKLMFDWSTAEGFAYDLFAGNGPGTEHPICKLASELGPDDLTLLGIYCLGYLRFESDPTLSQTHCLTVTMTTDDGKELSASIDVDFAGE